MKKYHILVLLSLLFVAIYFSNINVISANEFKEEVSQEAIETNNGESKKIALNSINECKEDIRKELLKIEEKLDNLKDKQEYKNFPAIRLNIDTPLFGLNSICNKKLKITNDVSTVDVARGYSIKDIIKNNSLKVPSFSVGSIVVITRDIKFDESITLSDANSCILKLMEYYKQVQSVNQFLDKQIVKIYSDYIPKERKEKITSLKSKLSNIRNEIESCDKDLTKYKLSSLNNENYNKYKDIYLDINTKLFEYSKLLENVLIDEKKLEEYEKKIDELEKTRIDLDKNIDELKNSFDESLDLENLFLNLRKEIISRKDNLEKYINDSIIEQEIKNEEIIEEGNEQSTENITASEEIKIYDVIDTNLIKDIEENINKLDELIEINLGKTVLNRIKGIESSDVSEEVLNKEEVIDVVTKEFTKEDKEKLLNDLSDIYMKILSIEKDFYLNNVDMLVKDTVTKISSLSKYTDFNSISDIKYIYIGLPDLLKKYESLYNKNSFIQVDSLISNIKLNLSKCIEINKVITKEYNTKISEDMKKSSRNN